MEILAIALHKRITDARVNLKSPALAPLASAKRMIGPTLPPHLRKATADATAISLDTTDNEEPKQNPVSSKPSVTGPELPPHLLAARAAKRKRERDEEERDGKEKDLKGGNASTEEAILSPSPKRHVGSSMPLPPPHIEQSNSDSDSDDDIGPSLSSMMTPAESEEYARRQVIDQLSRAPTQDDPNKAKAEPKLQRDSWMLAPPTRADWLGTLDASKLKARTFNQSRSGTLLQSGEADHTIWTETPLERAQRVEDEVLGRKPAKAAKDARNEEKEKQEGERDRRIKEYRAQTRGPSLMERHEGTRKAEEDDPSKRPFDYQRDIAGGQTLGFRERQAMINRAKNLDSKFAGSKYL